MSRKGDCWDNAVAESFFKTIKTELIYQNTFFTRAQARKQIFEYIESYYNGIRRHSTLGYKTPVQYERLQNAAYLYVHFFVAIPEWKATIRLDELFPGGLLCDTPSLI